MVYRGGELLKSFIQVTDTFGYNFDYDDIVDFLAECVVLTSFYFEFFDTDELQIAGRGFLRGDSFYSV